MMWFIVVVLMNGQHLLLPDSGLDIDGKGFVNSWTCEAVGKEMVRLQPNMFKESYCVQKEVPHG